jgi:NADH-quinone oxidoreductase subunit I
MVKSVREYFNGIVAIITGLLLTIKNLFRKKITIKYPEEKTPKSYRFKGLHALRRYANGVERCIGCKLCEAVCPAVAINIEPMVADNNSHYAKKYEIDLFKCIYCGLCEESCPTAAIVQTDITDYHFANRGEQILTKEKLLAIGDHYESQIIANRSKDAPY